MTKEDKMKISVEEFLRVQDWMRLSEKDSAAYAMKKRYVELKADFGFAECQSNRIGFD